MFVDGDDHAIHRHVETLGRGLDNAQIGLMRNQPVDRVAIEIIRGERLLDDAVERLDRDLEDFATLHDDAHAMIGFVREPDRDADRVPQEFLVSAVRVDMGRKNARIVIGLEYDCTRAIAEEHAGRPIRI